MEHKQQLIADDSINKASRYKHAAVNTHYPIPSQLDMQVPVLVVLFVFTAAVSSQFTADLK